MEEFNEELIQGKIQWKHWKRLFRYLLAHKKVLAILVIVTFTSGLIDAFFPVLQKYAVDNFIVKGQLDNL